MAHPFEWVSGNLYALHGKVIFYGLTPEDGYGFWSYDGKDASLISDNGGSSSSLAGTSDGFFYLSTYDVAKYSLLKHGGNPGVTLLIDDVKSNSQNNVPTVASVNGKAFYQDWEQTTGYELWSASDIPGSAALVLDGNPGTSSIFPTELTAADDLVYYRGGGTQGKQLWRSDGTAAGTYKLLHITATNQNIQSNSIRTIGNKAYFLIRKSSGETEFWESDGTVAGTLKLTDVPSCYATLDRFEAFFLNGKYVYLAIDPVTVVPTWAVTDGTPVGSEVLLNLPLNTSFNFSFYNSGSVKSILNGAFFFFCSNLNTNENELWKSDGSAAGTQKVQSLGNSVYPQTLASSKQRFFFLTQTLGNMDIQLWSSDGTPAGTTLTAPLGISQNYLNYGIGEATDSTILFRSPFYGPDIDYFPYRSDGTAQGTYPVEGIPSPHLAGSDPIGFTSGPNNAVFFRAFDNQFGGVWETTPAAPFNISRLDSLEGAYNYLEFGTPMPVADRMLWFSNDTTLKVLDASGAISQIPLPVNYSGEWSKGPGGAVFFMVNYNKSLWRTDGTPAGTFEVFTGSANSQLYGLKTAGDSLYFIERFTVPNQPNQYLWSSDGTNNGTQSIGTIEGGSTIFLQTVENRLAYSTYSISPYSRTLYVRGFEPVYFPDLNYEDFAGLAVTDSQLFVLGPRVYSPTDSIHFSLWTAENGQPNLLHKFKTIAGYQDYSSPPQALLHRLGNKVVFGAGLTEDNAELWTSDGSQNGALELRDINPSGSSNPDNFVRYNDQLWLFTANDGAEVAWWATNGASAGTFKVAGLATVKDYFVPSVSNAYLSDNRLFFSLNDGIIGQEPWVMVLEDSLVVSTLAPLLRENDLVVWPNPAKGFVQITLSHHSGKSVRIELIDNVGQVVYQQKHTLSEFEPLVIGLPQQSKGVHFLHLTDENGNKWIRKLIISE